MTAPMMAMAIISYVALTGLGEARAEPSVRVQVAGALPFSQAELEEVVSARVPLGGDGAGGVAVTVSAAGPDSVELRAGDRTAVVTIAGRTGISAARLVAVAIADLLTVEQAPAAPEPERVPVPPAVVEARAPSPAPAATPSEPAPPRRLSVALDVARGFGRAEPALFGGAADLMLGGGPGRHFLFGVGAGAAGAPTARAGQPDEASLMLAPIRVWAGVGWSHVEILGGPFAAPYRLGGAFQRTGVLGGAGVMARYRARLAGRTHLVAGVHADAFLNRLQVSEGDFPPGFATPRISAGIEVGLAWEFGR